MQTGHGHDFVPSGSRVASIDPDEKHLIALVSRGIRANDSSFLKRLAHGASGAIELLSLEDLSHELTARLEHHGR